MVGEYIIEALAQIPTEVEFASEFRYRNTPMTRDTLVFAISQSGETADTLGALRESRRKGYRTLGICNNVASTIARESDGGVYMHAGPEIGVAATKSFTSQVTILTLIGLAPRAGCGISRPPQGTRIIEALEALPDTDRGSAQAERPDQGDRQEIRRRARHALLRPAIQLSRRARGGAQDEGDHLPFREGHPSAELKHGIIALVRPELPSVFIAPDDAVFSKNLNNIEQVRARKGPVIAVTTGAGADRLAKSPTTSSRFPSVPDYVSPILTAIPLQLLAYHPAVELGRDVDKPRNLAKSVTVE